MTQNCKNYCHLYFVLLFTSGSFFARAQNVTSPYSILGIGDVDTRDFGRYFSSGSASIARRDATSYNFSNPASLTALPFKTMNFDINMRGRISTFNTPGTDTSTTASKDFIVKRATLAFKVSAKSALAFGLKPYSSVNYKFHYDQSILDGNTAYTKSIEGNGGINQYYLSAGTQIGKRLSTGITASWLSGSVQKVTQYSGTSLELDITKTETNFYYGGLFQGGIQYYSSTNKKWNHRLGLTGSFSTGLRSLLTEAYAGSGVAIKENTEKGTSFKMPVSIGLGYSAIKKERLILSVEGNYYRWPKQKVDYTNSFTTPVIRLSTGLDYSMKTKVGTTLYERSYLSVGANIENSYILVKNKRLWDYSFSVGGGMQMFRNVSANAGLEIGRRGNKSLGQIKEKYTQFIFGITMKDIWIGSRKYGRFY